MDLSKLTGVLRKGKPVKYCGAVIVAAGTASRMGGIDKIMAPLQGKSVIRRSVEAFENCDVIREIVVVTREDLIQAVSAACRELTKVRAVVVGGKDRQESVERGLNALSDKVKLTAIHDGARPLVSEAVIQRTVRAASYYGAAIPVIPVKDTVKEAPAGLVLNTPDRSRLRAVQTPQVFDLQLLRGALKRARDTDARITDDSSAVEQMGMSVKTVDGDERNIKVTTPLDLAVAAMLLEEKS